MITGKLLGVLAVVIVVCLALSGLVGWGVASATLSAAHGKSLTGASGASGATGADGANGSNGKDGATGATGPQGATGATGAIGATGATGKNGLSTGTQGPAGAKGATGATGAIGARGLTGLQGAPGAAGANGRDGTNGTNGTDGASAPSFATTSAAGLGVGFGVGFGLGPGSLTMGSPIGLLPNQIPAGPALVGFTVTLTDVVFDLATCSLVDTGTGAIVASAAPTELSPEPTAFSPQTPSTIATTQVVTLAPATTLQLQCSGFSTPLPVSYTDLSVYAISFAPQG